MQYGPYRTLNVIHSGQTSRVLEAVRDDDPTRVALKTLRPEKTDKEQIAFLRHEHMVGGKLDHPQLVKVLDFGESKEGPYLVMDLFRVPNLKQLILQGVDKLAPGASNIIEQAASALACFSRSGWIHRDIKPDNFLVSPEGEVKLIDFALAQKPKRGLSRMLARKAMIQGTPSYISPEQIRGKVLDVRTDVYSFGCSVYLLLCGKSPYTGMNVNELLTKHLRSAPPLLQSQNTNVTTDFSELVRRMLAKKPENRPTIDEICQQLRVTAVFKKTPKPPGEEEEEEFT